jgi:hypothetical protein
MAAFLVDHVTSATCREFATFSDDVGNVSHN